jgi:hypothetical protein
MQKNGPASRAASARSLSTQTDASSGGTVNIQTDRDINAQTDASSRDIYLDGWEINSKTDDSSGGKYSDRWGYKCTDRCLKWR